MNNKHSKRFFLLDLLPAEQTKFLKKAFYFSTQLSDVAP